MGGYNGGGGGRRKMGKTPDGLGVVIIYVVTGRCAAEVG